MLASVKFIFAEEGGLKFLKDKSYMGVTIPA